ncbi:hypothetical protein pb186bvf_013509 [Paramecium bursaria]
MFWIGIELNQFPQKQITPECQLSHIIYAFHGGVILKKKFLIYFMQNPIYIADDDETALKSIEMILKALGRQSELFQDGVAVVDAYKKNKNTSIILMDLNMPNLDGLEATKEIRTFEKSQGLQSSKIYGLTADNSQETKDECLKNGMNDVLIKPLTKARLQQIL